ncbi:MAG: MerR family transcriptional regulator [Anaerolineae bacterium]
MFKIGDFSKICRVPASALRYYANLGLFEPGFIDPATGYRYYMLEQLPRLNRILALRDLGLSLEQITLLMTEDVSAAELRGMLRLKQAEIQQLIDEEQARLARVAARLHQIEMEGTMPAQDVVLKAVEPQHILSIREIVPTPMHVGALLAEAAQAIMSKGIAAIAPPFTVYHDDEFKPADMDIEIVLPVDKSVTANVALDGGRWLVAREMPALPQVASIIHNGTYDTLDQSYAAMGQWITENGYHIVGEPHELYLGVPDEHGVAITEIQFPVAKG